MPEEGMPPVTNESEDQEYVNPIENWFQKIVGSQFSSVIRKLLISYQLKQLIFHTLVCVGVDYLKLSVSIFRILLRTWLHWKYSYT